MTATPVGKVFCLIEVVGGQQDGRSFAFECIDEFPELPARFGVKAGRRFIKEQHVGAPNDAQGDIKSATLPTLKAGQPWHPPSPPARLLR